MRKATCQAYLGRQTTALRQISWSRVMEKAEYVYKNKEVSTFSCILVYWWCIGKYVIRLNYQRCRWPNSKIAREGFCLRCYGTLEWLRYYVIWTLFVITESSCFRASIIIFIINKMGWRFDRANYTSIQMYYGSIHQMEKVKTSKLPGEDI